MTVTVKQLIDRLTALRPDASVSMSATDMNGREVIAPIGGVGNDMLKVVYLEGTEETEEGG